MDKSAPLSHLPQLQAGLFSEALAAPLALLVGSPGEAADKKEPLLFWSDEPWRDHWLKADGVDVNQKVEEEVPF